MPNDRSINFGLPIDIDVNNIVNGAIVKVAWNDRTETKILITNAWEIVRQRSTSPRAYHLEGFDLNDLRMRDIKLTQITKYVCGPRSTQETLQQINLEA